MTKAVVRAMDALTEFASEFNYKVEKFMIAGGSKVILF
jgi:PhoPQ-activated pathogenicity-related protein